MVIGLLLAAGAAVGFGSGTFIQHLTAVAVEHPQDRHRVHDGLLRLLARLVRQPRWLLGQVLAGGGTALQFSAMAFAPVAVVQPVIAAGLPVALVLEVVSEHRLPSLRQIAGMALCVGGLVVFVLFSRAGETPGEPGVVAAAVLLALAVAFAVIGRIAPSGQLGALISGAGAGGTFGIAAVCAALPIRHFQRVGVVGTMTHWSPYVAAAAGLLAVAAAQQAYARGELAWSLPALTVGNTMVATAVACLLAHENLNVGAAPIWSAGAAAAVVGVALTSMLHARRVEAKQEKSPAA